MKTKPMLPKAMLCGFVLTLLVSFFSAAAAGESLSEDVIRLHVVANSDSAWDQQVKLLVRDAVLEEADRFLAGVTDRQEAVSELCVHLGALEHAANRTLQEQGCAERARVEVTDAYFPTREYETFTLPAGTYRALRVTIGEGNGKNWWCVVFPALCLPAAEDADFSVLSSAQEGVVCQPEQFRVGLKLAEWYESLRNALDF